jgi:hypothetical protein
MSIVTAFMGLVLAATSMSSVVPRIRLVEAIGLFATAFGAGAALTAALMNKKAPGSRD